MTTDKKPVMVYLSDELINYLSLLASEKKKINKKGEPILATVITDLIAEQAKLNDTEKTEKTDAETINELKHKVETLTENLEIAEQNTALNYKTITLHNEQISYLSQKLELLQGEIAKLKQKKPYENETKLPDDTETKEPDQPEKNQDTDTTEIIKPLPETKNYDAAVEKIKDLASGGMTPKTIAQLIKSLGYTNKNSSKHWTYQQVSLIINQ